jgi:GNAT superfamily N-acetyltransferase
MPGNNIEVRNANGTDVHQLARLMTELGYETTDNEMQERLQNIFSLDHHKTLVAVYNGAIAGMAGATKNFFYEKNGKYVRLLSLVTFREYRKLGIASLLLEHVENWGRDIGAETIFLNCGNREERKVAHEFYIRKGFTARSTGYVKHI